MKISYFILQHISLFYIVRIECMCCGLDSQYSFLFYWVLWVCIYLSQHWNTECRYNKWIPVPLPFGGLGIIGLEEAWHSQQIESVSRQSTTFCFIRRMFGLIWNHVFITAQYQSLSKESNIIRVFRLQFLLLSLLMFFSNLIHILSVNIQGFS